MPTLTITVSDYDVERLARLGIISPVAQRVSAAIAEGVERAACVDELESDFDVDQRARVARTCTCRSTDHYHSDTCPFGPDDRQPSRRSGSRL